jgi:hypothetical protein
VRATHSTPFKLHVTSFFFPVQQVGYPLLYPAHLLQDVSSASLLFHAKAIYPLQTTEGNKVEITAAVPAASHRDASCGEYFLIGHK